MLVGKKIHEEGKSYLCVTSIIDGCIDRTCQDFDQLEGIGGGGRLMRVESCLTSGGVNWNNCFYRFAGRERNIGF